MFWNTVSLWPRYLPVVRSFFQRTPSLPALKTQFLAAVVHQDALEHFVQIQRLAGSVIEPPLQLAGIDVERHGRVGVGGRAVAGLPADARIQGLACATPQ